MKPLLHPKTELSLKSLVAEPRGTYLFAGLPKIGKFTAAIWVAQQLNCASGGCLSCSACRAIFSRNYPDLMVLEPNGASIGIDQVHALTQSLGLSRYYHGGKRVVIIDQAHALTVEAQSALLKTLEEPPLGTVILLISHKPERLLATILSRTMRVDFGLPGVALVINLLTSKGADKTLATRVVDLAQGHVGLAIELHQDPELLVRYEQLDQSAQALLEARSFERLCAVAKLLEGDNGAELVVQAMARRLRIGLRQAARNKPEALQAIRRQLDALEQYRRYIAANVSPKAALESLMLEM